MNTRARTGAFSAESHQDPSEAKTERSSDTGDLCVETFDEPGAPTRYRYGTRRRAVEEWTEDISSLCDTGSVDTLRATFRRTHRGPIVGMREDAGTLRPITARGWRGWKKADGARSGTNR